MHIFLTRSYLFLLLLLLPLALVAQTTESLEKVGDETCSDCHDELAAAFSTNTHSIDATEKGFVCESCHGPGSKHVEDNEPASIYNPAKDYLATTENPCLNCHNGGDFESVAGNAHYEMANGCSDCHVVHSADKKMLKARGNELCMSCHQDIAAKFRLTSHHPVAEGLMSCESCHQVHGATTKKSLADSYNELCFSCHASKEGPFVYEHQPVNEDCGICHDPHGTVANNLLVQNEPALCMSCHPMHFHTSITGFVGEFTNPLIPERSGVSTKDGMKAIMLTKCTQCHVEIHGSDLSSQGLISQGKSLTR